MNLQNLRSLITSAEGGSVFVEIGSDRGSNSTNLLADLAEDFGIRLISVDIDPGARDRDTWWTNYYRDIRAPDWPMIVPTWQDLSDELKQSIRQHNDYESYAAAHEKAKINDSKRANHPAVDWVTAKGSEWASQYKSSVGKKISCLLLDNYDWDYNAGHQSTDLLCKKLALEYQALYDINMSNHQCQIEHMAQMLHLWPFLSDDCLVILDDTYLSNNCFTGKSAAVLVFLVCQGYKIIQSDGTVFMRKFNQPR